MFLVLLSSFVLAANHIDILDVPKNPNIVKVVYEVENKCKSYIYIDKKDLEDKKGQEKLFEWIKKVSAFCK